MASLSIADTIKMYPIGKGLDAFRDSFCAELGLPLSSDSVWQLSHEDLRSRVLNLFIALQTLSAAQHLPSPTSHKILLGDLSKFVLLVVSDDFDVNSAAPLLDQVIKRATDEDIWSAVSTLVASQATPPTILNKGTFDTPLKSNSSSQQGSEQTHDEIDPRILQEINGCVYNNTKGFFEKYFEGKSWSTTVENIVSAAEPQIVDGRWTEYPNPPSEDNFYKWFWTFQAHFLPRTHYIYDTSHRTPLAGSDLKRQPDLHLTASHITKRDGKHNWTDVQVIGELKQSENRKEFKMELVRFCGYAREVFKYQPTRRFLHGFFIRGSIMELWVFDRSGPYSCEKFDIHRDPKRFVRVISGYTLMSDEELGMNTYIKEDNVGKHIMFKREDDETKEEKLYLEDRPIASQRAIVCRGTTCYRAKRQNSKWWEFVVKFSWRSDKRRAEGDLMKLAKERDVWGVAQLFNHHDLESIADLRRGMEFGRPQTFKMATESCSESQSRSGTLLSGLNISQDPPSSSSSGRKRKRQAKRSRSENTQRLSDITDLIKKGDDRPEKAGMYNVEQPNATSLMGVTNPSEELFANRIFSCLVISPPGRPIHDFKSVKEFLEACRDIIKAHKSLYQDGNILHRDISENNLIITDAKDEGEPRGLLIDLNLAKEVDKGPTGARYRTGTMEFMAIEVLKGTAHTYRHDLESFFYVFLWVIILGRDRILPQASRLRNWYKGAYDSIANTKRGHMDKRAFEEIIAEFPAEFQSLKGLAKELRDVLFPYWEGLFIGTYQDSDKLYKPMIDSFERAVAEYVEG